MNQNSITIVDSLNNNTNLFTNLLFPHTITNHMYIQLIQSSNLSKNITITLPSLFTNSTDFGSFYNFIINDNISSLTIKTSIGDILLGTNKFYSSQLISSNLIQSLITQINSNLVLDLLYSKIKIINISTNK